MEWGERGTCRGFLRDCGKQLSFPPTLPHLLGLLQWKDRRLGALQTFTPREEGQGSHGQDGTELLTPSSAPLHTYGLKPLVGYSARLIRNYTDYVVWP